MNANADDDLVDSITEYSVIVDGVSNEIVVTHRQGGDCHLIISQTPGSLPDEQLPQPSIAIIFPESFYSQNPLVTVELWPPSYSLTQDRLSRPFADEGVLGHEPLHMLSHESLIQLATGGDQQSVYPLALPMGPIEIQNKDRLYVIDPILQHPVVTACAGNLPAKTAASKTAFSRTAFSRTALSKTASSRSQNKPASLKPPASGKSIRTSRAQPSEAGSATVASSASAASGGQGRYQFHITGQLLLGIESPCTARAGERRMRKKTVTVPVIMLVSTDPAQGAAWIDSLSSTGPDYAVNIFRQPSQASSPINSVPDDSLQKTWEKVRRRAMRRIREEQSRRKVRGVRWLTGFPASSEVRAMPLMPKIQLRVVDHTDSVRRR
ncbi:hypothetical protein [Endozoicomonas sp. 4G]|uniref:hypothetical protein n=1 Tax=Endozoicomonas sp. 4G TaxID=2872754 RepID=UPI002078F6D2|nr:hypothetical protein [Endozoicomonas sp. 4G]